MQVFEGLVCVVQCYDTNSWRTMAAFDVVQIGEWYLAECATSNEDNSYRLVRKIGDMWVVVQ